MGAEISILNSEAMLPNVRTFNEKAEMLFNVAMPKKGAGFEEALRPAGHYVIRCGVHPWMYAIVVVREHPCYALTDGAGSFKI